MSSFTLEAKSLENENIRTNDQSKTNEQIQPSSQDTAVKDQAEVEKQTQSTDLEQTDLISVTNLLEQCDKIEIEKSEMKPKEDLLIKSEITDNNISNTQVTNEEKLSELSNETKQLSEQETKIDRIKDVSDKQRKELEQQQVKNQCTLKEILNKEIISQSEKDEKSDETTKRQSICSKEVTEITSKVSAESTELLTDDRVIPLTSMPSFKNINDMQKLSSKSEMYTEDIQSKTSTTKKDETINYTPQFYIAETFSSQSKVPQDLVHKTVANSIHNEQSASSTFFSEDIKTEQLTQSNSSTNFSQNTSYDWKNPKNPSCPSNINANSPKKNIKQDASSNPCFPKMQFNYRPVQTKNKVNNPSSSVQISNSTTTSSSSTQMSLASALTVAPEKPFSLATSPVNFSYTDTPSYLPAVDTTTTYTSFQPIETFSKTDKGKNIPIQNPFSPTPSNKPIVEFPASPKSSVPYKRTLSFPPPLPDELDSSESKVQSSEIYKMEVRAPSTPITNEHKLPLYMNIPRPASAIPKHVVPAVIPAYQSNIVSTQHRGVQANVFIPRPSKSTGFIGDTKKQLQQYSTDMSMQSPNMGNLNYDTGCETYHEESKVHHDYDKVTGLRRTANIQESMRHKEHSRQQMSNTSEVKTTPDMITTIERKHMVKEEYERTQKAKTIEIRTGPDGKVTRQEIPFQPQTPLSFPPPKLTPDPTQQFGQSSIKNHQVLSQSHQSATSSFASAYGPQSLNQCTLPQKTGFPTLKSPGVSSAAKTISNPLVCDPTPPGAGGAGAPKGGAFGVSTAPKRGRGILNKAVLAGSRVPLCGHCNSYVRLVGVS